MKRLSTAELRILYMRRQLLQQILETIPAQVQVNLNDCWRRELKRMQSIYDEISTIVEDERLSELIPRPEVSSPNSSTYSPTGTIINVVTTGKELIAYINTLLGFYVDSQGGESATQSKGSIKVFVGHGRDAAVRAKVKDFLAERCGFQPIILEDQPSTGLTVIEKLEKYGRQVEYAVLIMTGDDVSPEGESRARQNVIQELGWFQGVLGRRCTAILLQKDVDLGSNLAGIVYLGFAGDAVESTFEQLRKEFEEVGLLGR